MRALLASAGKVGLPFRQHWLRTPGGIISLQPKSRKSLTNVTHSTSLPELYRSHDSGDRVSSLESGHTINGWRWNKGNRCQYRNLERRWPDTASPSVADSISKFPVAIGPSTNNSVVFWELEDVAEPERVCGHPRLPRSASVRSAVDQVDDGNTFATRLPQQMIFN